MAETLGLIKFSKRQHVESFVNEGEMLFRPLEYFQGLEGDPLRGDPDEGLGLYQLAPRIEKVTIDGREFTVKDGTLSKATYRVWKYIGTHVFCCYAVAPASNHWSLHVDPRNLEFGDYYASIYDADRFFQKLEDAIESAGFTPRHRLVEYVDPEIYTGDMNPFRKFTRFAYQSEYRVAVRTGLSGPWKIKIGSLKSIADVAPSSSVNSSLTLGYNLLPARGATSPASEFGANV